MIGVNYMKNKGFTIIEMIVALAVFSLVIGASTSILVSGLRAQRHNLAAQEVLSQTSYVMEYMSRALRMAKKDLTGLCLTTVGAKYNYETNLAGDRLRFVNSLGKCQEFFLDSGRIKEFKSTDSSAASFPATPQDLTSDNLQVSIFSVVITGAQQPPADYLQPRVTISLNILGREQSEIKIQTTISQRDSDVRQ